MSGRLRSRAALLAVVAAFVPALVLAAPAAAHNYLVSSTPAEDATLTQLPEEFSVTTNEPLLDVSGSASGFALQVTDDAGSYYGDGCLTVAGSTLSTAASLGDAGEYTVGSQVVSADGHTVDGEFRFTWAPPSTHEPAAGAAAPPACGAEGSPGAEEPAPGAESTPDSAAPVSATDLLWVAGTVVVVGVVLVLTLLLLTRRRRP